MITLSNSYTVVCSGTVDLVVIYFKITDIAEVQSLMPGMFHQVIIKFYPLVHADVITHYADKIAITVVQMHIMHCEVSGAVKNHQYIIPASRRGILFTCGQFKATNFHVGDSVISGSIYLVCQRTFICSSLPILTTFLGY